MSHSTRRHLEKAAFLVATLGAVGLMISAVVDIQARTVLLSASLVACVGSGVARMILLHSRRPGQDPAADMG
jgi:hypothetical protein